MAEVYRPRHPERTVLYRVLSHHFEQFVAERPPPTHLVYQEVLMAAEAGSEHFS